MFCRQSGPGFKQGTKDPIPKCLRNPWRNLSQYFSLLFTFILLFAFSNIILRRNIRSKAMDLHTPDFCFQGSVQVPHHDGVILEWWNLV